MGFLLGQIRRFNINELIKIEEAVISNDKVNAVSARELHKLLGVRSHYKDWIRNRLTKYDFQEGIDFCCLAKTLATQTEGGRSGSSTYTDHLITLDVAKELCMVENNAKGREARRYFIECEKQLRQAITPKQSYLLGILSATDELSRAIAINKYEVGYVQPLEYKVAEQAQTIEANKPKVTYHDIVLRCPNFVSVSEIAKDFDISAVKLNKILADNKVQYRDRYGKWAVYQKYKEEGLAATATRVISENGVSFAKQHLKWTQKGRMFIYKMLKAEGILPICEQSD